MPKQQDSFEFSGPRALQRARNTLKSIDLDEGTVEQLHIEVTTSYPEDTTVDVEQDKEQSGGGEEKGDDRELKEIQANTSHHKVLWALSEKADEQPVPVGELIEAANKPEGSVYSAMTDLYQRKLVDRERERVEGQNQYVYKMTDHGRAMLNDLGEPEW